MAYRMIAWIRHMTATLYDLELDPVADALAPWEGTELQVAVSGAASPKGITAALKTAVRGAVGPGLQNAEILIRGGMMTEPEANQTIPIVAVPFTYVGKKGVDVPLFRAPVNLSNVPQDSRLYLRMICRVEQPPTGAGYLALRVQGAGRNEIPGMRITGIAVSGGAQTVESGAPIQVDSDPSTNPNVSLSTLLNATSLVGYLYGAANASGLGTTPIQSGTVTVSSIGLHIDMPR